MELFFKHIENLETKFESLIELNNKNLKTEIKPFN